MTTVKLCPSCGEKAYKEGASCATCGFAGAESHPVFAGADGQLATTPTTPDDRPMGTFTREPDGRAHLTTG